MGSPTGKPEGILGYAYVPNSNEPGKLKSILTSLQLMEIIG